MEDARGDRLIVPGVGDSQLPAGRLAAERRSPVAPAATEAARALAEGLRRAIEGEVRFDDGARALYATDASNYRQVPIGVVVPRTIEDVVATVALCRRYGAPVLARGGGTSLAGQCCNVAVVIDFSKHLNGLVALDPSERSAWVEPGMVLDDLRAAAERHGLTFGPDPATHDRCTLGGMIGNDSCGVHSVQAGRTSDNVLALEVLTYDGARLVVGPAEDDLAALAAAPGREGEIHGALRSLRDRHADEIRRRYPRLERRVSGYALPWLLPEQGFHVARALVGTEGTCAIVLRARLRLVESPPRRSLLVIGFEDVFAAADAVPEIRRFGPIGLEGIDERLVQDMKKKRLHPERVELLPDGRGWLLVEFGGQDARDAEAAARRLLHALPTGRAGVVDAKLFTDPAETATVWRVRESGLGATARVPGQPDTWEGWEDAAVPHERLGAYLREFRGLLERHGYTGALYGHFGQGCVHTRIDFDLATREGVARYRAFIVEAADLVVSHGGSLSGEHGDGQARAELLPRMYGAELVEAFREFKAIWDPAWKLNPGKVVEPFRADQNLRLGPGFVEAAPRTHFAFREDDARFGRAVGRCVGVGACRRARGGVMCPSWRATREEMHSTRGRARLLFEMLNGDPLRGGWRDEHVKRSLDLCLSCKGCKSDCPVNVDLATYKAEFLSHYYARRLRPRAAYAMGLVMYWARLAALAPRLANGVASAPGAGRLVKALAGVASERALPRFAPYTFRRWFLARRRHPAKAPRGAALLFPDTFVDHFEPGIGISAVEVLERSGYAVEIPRRRLCCGRPLYDWGMLRLARRHLRGIVDALAPAAEAGVPIVGLEPSCVAVFRDELPDLLADDPRAARVAAATVTLSELLDRDGVAVPPLQGRAVAQPHCHHHAIMGFDPERRVLERAGLEVEVLDEGCCGMAGAFGFEAGERFDVSISIGELGVLPAVRRADGAATIVADGFSCREQIAQRTGRRARHLAEVLAGRRDPLPRLPARSRVARTATWCCAVLAGVGIWAAARAAREH